MDGGPGLPMERIPSVHSFVVFSESAGLISEHLTGADAEKSFAEYLRKARYLPKIGREPAIYKRESDGWHVY